MTTTVDTTALGAALDSVTGAKGLIESALGTLDQAVTAARAAITTTPDEPPIVAPIARGDAVSVQTDSVVTIDLWANDEAGSAPLAGVRVLGGPTLGVLVTDGAELVPGMVVASGRVGYAAGHTPGADTILYQDVDADGNESVPAPIAITVTSPSPPPPPPPPAKARLLAFHGASSGGGPAPAPDVLAVAEQLAKNIVPRAPAPNLIPCWLGKDSYKLMRPGAGLKANFPQQCTDKGAVMFLSFPMAWKDKPPGCPAGTSVFEDVIAGRHDQLWADALGWFASQGQTAPILRWVEPNGSFPWAARNAKEANLGDVKVAATYFFKAIKKNLPTARIVIGWFHDGFGPNKVKIHPDDIAPKQELYDGNDAHVYDGQGRALGAATAKAFFGATNALPDGRKAPDGADTWRAWNNSRKCADGSTPMFGIGECGNRTDVNGDNPEFWEQLQARVQGWGDCHHVAIFKPQSGVTKIWPQTDKGGTKALGALQKAWNVAA